MPFRTFHMCLTILQTSEAIKSTEEKPLLVVNGNFMIIRLSGTCMKTLGIVICLGTSYNFRWKIPQFSGLGHLKFKIHCLIGPSGGIYVFNCATLDAIKFLLGRKSDTIHFWDSVIGFLCFRDPSRCFASRARMPTTWFNE